MKFKVINNFVGACKVLWDFTGFFVFRDKEYGSIEATVKNISLVLQQENYQVEPTFTHELTTTYREKYLSGKRCKALPA